MEVGRAEIGIGPDLSGFAAHLRARLAPILARAAGDVKVKVDVERSGLGILDALRERLRGTGADAEAGGAGVSSLRRALTQAAGGALALSAGMALIGWPALSQGIGAAIGGLGALAAGAVAAVAALAPLAGLLPAIAAGALAGGQAFGVVALATAGLGGALKELTVDADKSAKSSEAAAERQHAAAERVRNAREGLSRAVRNEARAREQAIRRIEDAEEALADTTEDAAERQRDALRAVAAAEERLADAQRNTRRAQEDLNDARRDARKNIDDLRTSLARLALDEEDAILSVHEAWKDLQDAFADPRADDLVRQRAELRYRQAQANLEDQRREAAELRREEAAASAAGVDGSERVRDARERVADSMRAERAAAAGVAEAQYAAARSQVESAEAVRDAMRNVALAHRDAGEQQADASRAVTEAQHDLAEAIRQVERAAAQMGDTSKSKLADLAPATQNFARFLAGLRPLFDDLRQTAAAGLFPGVEAGITAVLPLFPALRDVIGSTAGVIGGFAADLGRLVASPAFSSQLVAFGQANVGIIDQFGQAVLALLPGLLAILTAAQPLVMWLGQLATRWAENFTNAMQAAQASGALAGFLERTRAVVENLLGILGNLAGAFGNIGRAAAPLGEAIFAGLLRASEGFERLTGSVEGQNAMRAYFDSVMPVLEAFGGLFGDIAAGFGRIAVAATPALLPIIAAVRDNLLPALVELFSKIDGEFLASLVNLAASLAGVLSHLTGAGPLITPIIDALSGFLDVVRFLLTDVPFLSDFLRTVLTVMAAYSAVRGVTLIFQGLFLAMKAYGTLGFLPGFFTVVKGAMLALISPPGLIVAALAIAVFLIVKHWDTIKEAIAIAARWIGDRIGDIVEFFSKLPGRIGGFIGEVVGFFGKLPGRFAEAVGFLLREASELPGKILRALGNLGGMLLGAGWDLMLGLARGIRDKAGEVIDAIKRFVLDKVPGFVKRFFGISSPSKMMMRFGAELPRGLAVGIQKNAGAVSAALRGLVPDGMPGLDGGGGGALAGPLGGRSGVTVNGGASAAELESILARLLSGARPVSITAYERENPMHFARRMLWEMG